MTTMTMIVLIGVGDGGGANRLGPITPSCSVMTVGVEMEPGCRFMDAVGWQAVYVSTFPQSTEEWQAKG